MDSGERFPANTKDPRAGVNGCRQRLRVKPIRRPTPRPATEGIGIFPVFRIQGVGQNQSPSVCPRKASRGRTANLVSGAVPTIRQAR